MLKAGLSKLIIFLSYLAQKEIVVHENIPNPN